MRYIQWRVSLWIQFKWKFAFLGCDFEILANNESFFRHTDVKRVILKLENPRICDGNKEIKFYQWINAVTSIKDLLEHECQFERLKQIINLNRLSRSLVSEVSAVKNGYYVDGFQEQRFTFTFIHIMTNRSRPTGSLVI